MWIGKSPAFLPTPAAPAAPAPPPPPPPVLEQSAPLKPSSTAANDDVNRGTMKYKTTRGDFTGGGTNTGLGISM